MSTKTKTTMSLASLQLLPTWKNPITGKTERCGFLLLTMIVVRFLLTINTRNRVINWPHAVTLATSLIEGRWVWGANMISAAFSGVLTDGQHRLIATILAYGSEDDLSWLITTFCPANAKGEPETPRAVASFRTATLGQPGWQQAIPMVENIDPRAFEVQDQDMRKRTGADMLLHNATIANWLDSAGLSGVQYQTILRFAYLRTTPGKSYSGSKGVRYGSLAKGGNISPQRYQSFEATYGVDASHAHNLIADAMEDTPTTVYGFNACPYALLPYVYTLGILLEGLSREDLDLYAKYAKRFQVVVQNSTRMKVEKSGVYTPDLKGIAEVLRKLKAGNKAMPKSGWIMSALVHSIRSPKSDTLTHIDQWTTTLGSDPEQNPLFRLEGPDSAHTVDE